VLELIEEFPIRRQPASIDGTLNAVDADEPAKAFSDAKRQLAPLSDAVRRVETVTDYAFWADRDVLTGSGYCWRAACC